MRSLFVHQSVFVCVCDPFICLLPERSVEYYSYLLQSFGVDASTCYEEHHTMDVDYLMAFCVLGVITSLVLATHWFLSISVSPYGNDWSSWFLSLCLGPDSRPDFKVCSIRSIFSSMMDGKPQVPIENHSHGVSARIRDAAAQFMESFASSVGRTAYFVQQSAADQRRGRAGCRSWYWSKDATASYAPYELPANPVIVLADVDYYLDMNYLFCYNLHPIILSTFQPNRAAGLAHDYTYYFDKDNHLHYQVAGGAEYVHPLWNYGSDFITFTHRSFGMEYSTIYNVDRRRTAENHEIILLTPVRRVKLWLLCLSYFITTNALSRLEPVVFTSVGAFVRLKVLENTREPDGKVTTTSYMCTSKVGCLASAKIPTHIDDTIAAQARMASNPLTVASVCLCMSRDAPELVSQETATILCEFHRTLVDRVSPVVYPLADSISHYQYRPSLYDENAKHSLVPFMSPLILGSFSPDKCLGNDKACVDNRINKIKADISVSPQIRQLSKEFVELLVPAHLVGTGHPYSIDQMLERQNRPTQRHIISEGASLVPGNDNSPIRSFQKAESYSDIKDPRNISTLSPVKKVGLTPYSMAYYDAVLIPQPWCAIGKTPKQISQRVVEICSVPALLPPDVDPLSIDTIPQEVGKTDFSRMDGRVNNFNREEEQQAMLRWFAPQYHEHLLEEFASHTEQRGITKFGVSYEQGNSRASGDSDTAGGNTSTNAGTAYKAIRRTPFKTKYGFRKPTPVEAFKMLGIYLGDDGLTANVPREIYENTATDVGHVLDYEPVARGQPGVMFLARCYGPSVWHGDANSTCDVLRQLSKLHVTTVLAPNVTGLQKLGEKLAAFKQSDANSPVLGELIQAVEKCDPTIFPGKVGAPELRGVAIDYALAPANEQYPNVYSEWMDDIFNNNCPSFDWSAFRIWTSCLKNGQRDLLLKPPLCVSIPTKPIEIKEPVVVNGQPRMVTRKPQTSAKKSEDEAKEKSDVPSEYQSNKPCRFIQSGKTCKFGDKCKFSHVLTIVILVSLVQFVDANNNTGSTTALTLSNYNITFGLIWLFLIILCYLLMASVAKALVKGLATVAKVAKAKKRGKKKKNNGKSKGGLEALANNINHLANVSVPVSSSAVMARYSRSEVVIRVPFASASIFMIVKDGGGMGWNTNGNLTSTVNNYDINPVQGLYEAYSSGNYNAPFGVGIASIGQSFARFTFQSPIKCVFITNQPVTNAGVVDVGWSAEPNYTNNALAAPSTDMVLSCRPSVSFPVWCPPKDMIPLVIPAASEWFYVYSDDGSNSTDRFTAHGTLLANQNGFSGGTPTVIGRLHCTGVVSFKGLTASNTDGLPTARLVPWLSSRGYKSGDLIAYDDLVNAKRPTSCCQGQHSFQVVEVADLTTTSSSGRVTLNPKVVASASCSSK